jgi:hypothetical protein
MYVSVRVQVNTSLSVNLPAFNETLSAVLAYQPLNSFLSQVRITVKARLETKYPMSAHGKGFCSCILASFILLEYHEVALLWSLVGYT